MLLVFIILDNTSIGSCAYRSNCMTPERIMWQLMDNGKRRHPYYAYTPTSPSLLHTTENGHFYVLSSN
jgi:hypothetical protein